MDTYIILSKISPGSLKKPSELKEIADSVKTRIKENCPDCNWKSSYAVRGQYDIVDVVETNNENDIDKIVMILRTYGYEDTVTMEATEWTQFLETANNMTI